MPVSARLILASSGLNEVKRKKDADLVFRFTRDAQPGKRTSSGDEIKIRIDNIYTLEVVDQAGNMLWKDSDRLLLPTKPPDRSSAGRERYLKSQPPAKLIEKFLRDRGN